MLQNCSGTLDAMSRERGGFESRAIGSTELESLSHPGGSSRAGSDRRRWDALPGATDVMVAIADRD